jgi:hypothetical protein
MIMRTIYGDVDNKRLKGEQKGEKEEKVENK